MSDSKPYIGGQAVIEGVMMRAPGCMSIAVRRPDGGIAVQEGPMRSKLATSRMWKLPLLRGVATLVESLSVGMRALQFSVSQQMVDEEGRPLPEEAEGGGRWVGFVSILFALLLFKGAPQGLGWLASRFLGIEGVQDPRFHLVTGGFQLLVLLGYLLAVSRLPEMRRVFQYHGAEHKTISAYEKALPLTVENVRAQTTLHPRCGTTFLVVVVAVSIVVGAIVTPLVLPGAAGLVGQLQTLALRVSMLPFIAGISFELQRFTARYCTTGPLRVLLWPGFLFQKITTREPDDAQLEIAIAAMESAIWREKVGAQVHADEKPLVFGSFAAFEQAVRSSLRGAGEAAAA
jgi:uncharacterized protein YqhQ